MARVSHKHQCLISSSPPQSSTFPIHAYMAPTANRSSSNDLENFFRNVNHSKKSHCQEPGDDDYGLASAKRVGEDLKEMLASNSFAGLVTKACSKATRFIFTRMEAKMRRGGTVDLDGDKTEKQQLANQLGSNLEFWLFYAFI